MSASHRTRPLVALILLTIMVSPVLAARMVTEVIPVGFRDAEELLGVIRPLVPAPGSVSALYGKLVVKTTPENMEEVKDVLERLDKAPRNLLVSVRFGRAENFRTREVETFGELQAGDVTLGTGREPSSDRGGFVIIQGENDSEAGVRVLSTEGRADQDEVHRVRVLEGQEAFVQSGSMVPVGERSVRHGWGIVAIHEGVRYKPVTSGFLVRPRVQGDRVIVEVSPQRARLSDSGGGVVDFQQATTTVSGRLGEWMAIGGVNDQIITSRRSTVYSTESRDESLGEQMYLKVEDAGR